MQKVITKDNECIELHNIIHMCNNSVSFLPYDSTTLIHMNTFMASVVNSEVDIVNMDTHALLFDDITLCHIFVASKTILGNYTGDDVYVSRYMNFLVSCCKYNIEQIIGRNLHIV